MQAGGRRAGDINIILQLQNSDHAASRASAVPRSKAGSCLSIKGPGRRTSLEFWGQDWLARHPGHGISVFRFPLFHRSCLAGNCGLQCMSFTQTGHSARRTDNSRAFEIKMVRRFAYPPGLDRPAFAKASRTAWFGKPHSAGAAPRPRIGTASRNALDGQGCVRIDLY